MQSLLWSFNFDPLQNSPQEDRWDAATRLLSSAANALRCAGADSLVIYANPMHRMADEVQAAGYFFAGRQTGSYVSFWAGVNQRDSVIRCCVLNAMPSLP